MEEIYKDSFWTGYYSSRANSKKAMREFSSYTQMASTLYALDLFNLSDVTSNLSAEESETQALIGEVGLLQHHDTITGTSYQYVNDDFEY